MSAIDLTGSLGFALLRPLWLLALPALALLLFVARRRASRRSRWVDAVDPPLYAALERLGRVVPAATGPAAGIGRWAALAAAIMAVALAGPAREARDGATYRNLDAVVLMVDVAPDAVQGDRLTAVVTGARQLAEAAGSRPVALVVYAGDAYVASTFTTDAAALGTTIAVLDGETVPDRGDRPERALALARRMVREAGVVSADFVLVAPDGRASGALAEGARAVGADGHRLSVLVTGPAVAAADVGGLGALARLGGGTAAEVADPTPLARAIGGQRASRLAEAGLAALVWSDAGRLVLAVALVPALMLFRRRG